MKYVMVLIGGLGFLFYGIFYFILGEQTGIYYPLLLLSSFGIIYYCQLIFYFVSQLYFENSPEDINLREITAMSRATKYLSFMGVFLQQYEVDSIKKYRIIFRFRVWSYTLISFIGTLLCFINLGLAIPLGLLSILPAFFILKSYELQGKIDSTFSSK